MRTVIVTGDEGLPEELEEIIARGSTSTRVQAAPDVPTDMPAGLDRIVFWERAPDDAVRRVAERWCGTAHCDAKPRVSFISAGAAGAPRGIAPDDWFVWPRDKEKLMLVFMTGA
jgi:hypothetical protein